MYLEMFFIVIFFYNLFKKIFTVKVSTDQTMNKQECTRYLIKFSCVFDYLQNIRIRLSLLNGIPFTPYSIFLSVEVLMECENKVYPFSLIKDNH